MLKVVVDSRENQVIRVTMPWAHPIILSQCSWQTGCEHRPPLCALLRAPLMTASLTRNGQEHLSTLHIVSCMTSFVHFKGRDWKYKVPVSSPQGFLFQINSNNLLLIALQNHTLSERAKFTIMRMLLSTFNLKLSIIL